MGNFVSSARTSQNSNNDNNNDNNERRESPLPSSVYPGRYNLRRTVQRLRRRASPPVQESSTSQEPALEQIYRLGDARGREETEDELEEGRRSRPRFEERPSFSASVPLNLNTNNSSNNNESQAEGAGDVNRFRRALEFIRQMQRHSTTPAAATRTSVEGEDIDMANIVVTVRILAADDRPSSPSEATTTNAVGSGGRPIRFEYTVYFLSYSQNGEHPHLTPQQIALIESRIQNMVAGYTELASLVGGGRNNLGFDLNTYEGLSALQEMLGMVPRGAPLDSIEQQLGKQLFKETGLAAGFACSICLGEVQEEDATRKLPCGHVFHVDCIDTWLQQCNKCPLCRSQPIDTSTTPSRLSSSQNVNSTSSGE